MVQNSGALKELIKISGTVSGLKENLRFRIGNRPAYTIHITPNLENGDVVTAVGYGAGEFCVCALRNETTKLVYSASEPAAHVDVLGLIGGIIMLPFLIGLVILWGVWKNYKIQVGSRDFGRAVNRLMNSA